MFVDRTAKPTGTDGDLLCNRYLQHAVSLLHADQSPFTLACLDILFPFSSSFKENYCIYV